MFLCLLNSHLLLIYCTTFPIFHKYSPMSNIYIKISVFLQKRLSRIYIGRLTRRYNKNTLLNSRWYRFAFAECGENLRIYGSPLIQNPELVHVGNNVTINEGAQINPNGHIYIGNNVTISSGVKIITNTLDTDNWVENRLKKIIDHKGKDIIIADGTWLCANSIVLPGVRILGKGVIVAAGSVVTKDIINDFVLVGGVPARVINRLR